jgi:hypothetical protein
MRFLLIMGRMIAVTRYCVFKSKLYNLMGSPYEPLTDYTNPNIKSELTLRQPASRARWLPERDDVAASWQLNGKHHSASASDVLFLIALGA